jgi:hypothetical protein
MDFGLGQPVFLAGATFRQRPGAAPCERHKRPCQDREKSAVQTVGTVIFSIDGQAELAGKRGSLLRGTAVAPPVARHTAIFRGRAGSASSETARCFRDAQTGEPCLQVIAECLEQMTVPGVGGGAQIFFGILKERFEQALLKFSFRGSSDSIEQMQESARSNVRRPRTGLGTCLF